MNYYKEIYLDSCKEQVIPKNIINISKKISFNNNNTSNSQNNTKNNVNNSNQISSELFISENNYTETAKGYMYSTKNYIFTLNVYLNKLNISFLKTSKSCETLDNIEEKYYNYENSSFSNNFEFISNDQFFYKRAFFEEVDDSTLLIFFFSCSNDNISKEIRVIKFDLNDKQNQCEFNYPINYYYDITQYVKNNEFVFDFDYICVDTSLDCFFLMSSNHVNNNTSTISLFSINIFDILNKENNSTYNNINSSVLIQKNDKTSYCYNYEKFINSYDDNDSNILVSALSSAYNAFFQSDKSSNNNKLKGINNSKRLIAVKYIGNEMIAYLTEDLIMTIYNIVSKETIRKLRILEDISSISTIKSAKIESFQEKFDSNKLFAYKSKYFIIYVYVNYDGMHSLQMFKLQFLNISNNQIKFNNPSSQSIINFDYNDSNINKNNLEYLLLKDSKLYEYIDLGKDNRLSFSIHYPLDGALIDSKMLDDSITFLTETKANRKYYNDNYDSLIFDINNQKFKKERNFLNNSINFRDKYIRNVNNIIELVINYSNNFEEKLKLIVNLLLNKDLFEEDRLVYYFNKYILMNKNLDYSISQILNSNSFAFCLNETNNLLSNNTILNSNALNNPQDNSLLNDNITYTNNVKNFLQMNKYINTLLEYCTKSLLIKHTTNKDANNNKKEINTNNIKKILEFMYYFVKFVINSELDNAILSLGTVDISEFYSLCILRKNGISFVKYSPIITNTSENVFSLEYQLRNIIQTEYDSYDKPYFNDNSYDSIKNLKNNLLYFEIINTKNNPINAINIFLSYIRILNTDSNINLEDFQYCLSYFNRNITSDDNSYKNLFSKMLTYNSCDYEGITNCENTSIIKNVNMSFIHYQLRHLFKSFSQIIRDQLLKTVEEVKKYLNFEHLENNLYKDLNDISNYNLNINKFSNLSDSINNNNIFKDFKLMNFKINLKLVKLLAKLIIDKVNSIYLLIRDSYAASKYIINLINYDVSNSEELNISEFEEISGRLQYLLLQCHSTLLFVKIPTSLTKEDSKNLIDSLDNLYIKDVNNSVNKDITNNNIMNKANSNNEVEICMIEKILIHEFTKKGLLDIKEYTNSFIDKSIKNVWMNKHNYLNNLKLIINANFSTLYKSKTCLSLGNNCLNVKDNNYRLILLILNFNETAFEYNYNDNNNNNKLNEFNQKTLLNSEDNIFFNDSSRLLIITFLEIIINYKIDKIEKVKILVNDLFLIISNSSSDAIEYFEQFLFDNKLINNKDINNSYTNKNYSNSIVVSSIINYLDYYFNSQIYLLNEIDGNNITNNISNNNNNNFNKGKITTKQHKITYITEIYEYILINLDLYLSYYCDEEELLKIKGIISKSLLKYKLLYCDLKECHLYLMQLYDLDVNYINDVILDSFIYYNIKFNEKMENTLEDSNKLNNNNKLNTSHSFYNIMSEDFEYVLKNIPFDLYELFINRLIKICTNNNSEESFSNHINIMLKNSANIKKANINLHTTIITFFKFPILMLYNLFLKINKFNEAIDCLLLIVFNYIKFINNNIDNISESNYKFLLSTINKYLFDIKSIINNHIGDKMYIYTNLFNIIRNVNTSNVNNFIQHIIIKFNLLSIHSFNNIDIDYIFIYSLKNYIENLINLFELDNSNKYSTNLINIEINSIKLINNFIINPSDTNIENYKHTLIKSTCEKIQYCLILGVSYNLGNSSYITFYKYLEYLDSDIIYRYYLKYSLCYFIDKIECITNLKDRCLNNNGSTEENENYKILQAYDDLRNIVESLTCSMIEFLPNKYEIQVEDIKNNLLSKFN